MKLNKLLVSCEINISVIRRVNQNTLIIIISFQEIVFEEESQLTAKGYCITSSSTVEGKYSTFKTFIDYLYHIV